MSISQQNVLHLVFLLRRQCPRTSACSAKLVLPIGICDACSNNQNYKFTTLKLSKFMVPKVSARILTLSDSAAAKGGMPPLPRVQLAKSWKN